MTAGSDTGRSWEHLGRAAEHFARRVARDARRFAERIEEHAGAFAHDVAQDWRCRARAHRPAAAPDVRRVFEDARAILSDVIDGVDELITHVFHESAEEAWTRAIYNKDAACDTCGCTTAAGAEGYVRRTPGRTQFRCLACGIPPEDAARPSAS